MQPDSKQPYVRFFVSDWLGGTRGMKANEIGIYITLIMLMYERGGPIPENPDRLSRQCGCTPKTFTPILEMLVDDGKIRRVEGGLWNGRVEKEFDFRQKKSDSNSDAAKSRWKKPKENNGGTMHPHSGSNASAMPIPDTIFQNKEKEPEGSQKNGGEPPPSQPDLLPAVVDPPKPAEPPKPTPRQILETVLRRETAEAVLKHRNRIRKPMTDRAAELLAEKFGRCTDPDAAADMMIANGWQGFEAEWFENRQQHTQAPSRPTTQRASGFLADLAREPHGDERHERLGFEKTGGTVVDATRLIPGNSR